MEAERRELEFLRTLGSGGFGAVYLANLHGRDRFVRRVAVKVMREGLDATPDLVARQKDEARLLGLLAHDGIVQVLDLAEVEGRPAVVMEYVEGVDLADLIKSSPQRIPVRVALELVAGVASALDAAFNSTSAVTGQPLRVIHRDIKPANMLLTIHGRVKVLDFGVAKADFARDGHTTNGGWGTPRFMSPEQWLGEAYGAAVDIYALGVTLFDLVAGRSWERPPLARTAFEHHVCNQFDAQTDVPEPVLALVAAMTAFDPADRPTAAEVRERCEILASEVGGESLARFARVHVPPLVEARSRSNANKPLPGAVSLGGVSSTNGGGGRAEPTHEPSVLEPSIVATPPAPVPATPPFRPVVAGVLVVGLLGLFVAVVGLVVVAWKLSGGPAPGPDAMPTATAPIVAAPIAANAPSITTPEAPTPEATPDGEVTPEATAGAATTDAVPSSAVVAPEVPAATPAKAPAPGRTKPTGKTGPSESGTARAETAVVITPKPPPAEKPAVEEPKAAPTYPFDIDVSTKERVAVWVDGRPIGNTPVENYSLRAGNHTLVVASGEGRSPAYEVTVGPDGPPGAKFYPSETKWRNTK